MAFELIEHTADVGLRVWADDLDELFAEAALGLIAVMGEAHRPADSVEHVDVTAPDLEALMVDWLSEVLYLFEVRGLVPVSVRTRVLPGWSLTADLEGTGPDAFTQHGPAVKAVTYHGVEVSAQPGQASATVYLDV